ncbi:hypothetical protein VTN77DRAFT_3296 [Rasamsonia byssochlamydoides]|uniref:uncharacterized protein n=1 Tax=Rasamsonia byssochlamydoides TaxID=89139 RepID=UPI0037424B5A
MSFQPTPTDVSVIISTPSSGATADNGPSLATERRVTPSWTVSQLKGKLETMTGIPPGSQKLLLKAPGREDQWVEGDERLIGEWGLTRGCEIEVHDTRPPSARPNFSDLSSVEKYELPTSTYEALPNSVLAWKKAQKLGRFDPNAQSPEQLMQEQAAKDQAEVQKRGITVSARAIILPSSPPHVRRGTIRYVGPVPEIPFAGMKGKVDKEGPLPIWVGIELDEPTGKNDGSIGGKRYFECADKRGVFVKPDKVEVGDFPPLELDDELDDAMEEI